MGKVTDFIVIGAVQKPPLNIRIGQSAILATYVRAQPKHQYEGMDLSGIIHPALSNISHSGDCKIDWSIEQELSGQIRLSRGFLNEWYAQIPFEAASLWETAKRIREETDVYTTVLPRLTKDIGAYRSLVAQATPELRDKNGRIQETELFEARFSYMKRLLLRAAERGSRKAIHHMNAIKYFFPISSGLAENLAHDVEHTIKGPNYNSRALERTLNEVFRKAQRHE